MSQTEQSSAAHLAGPGAYPDNWAHLADEIARVELLVRAALARMGVSEPDHESLRGLYLSSTDVQRLLAERGEDSNDVRALLAQAADLNAIIADRRAASLAAGVPLRLPWLARRFALTPGEEQLLLLCLAPELDQRYEKFYAYLNDDLTRKGPTLHLAMALVFPEASERAEARGMTGSTSPVFRAELIQFADESHAPGGRLGRVLRIDERIADFLLGLDRLPASIESFADVIPPQPHRPSDMATRLAAAVREHLEEASARRLVVHLVGPAGVGKRSLAETVCSLLGTTLVVVDLEDLAASGEPLEQALRLAAREALLQPAALYLSGVDRLRPPSAGSGDAPHSGSGAASWSVVGRVLKDFGWLTFLGCERAVAPMEGSGWRHHASLRVDFAAPDDTARVALWAEALEEYDVDVPSDEAAALAGRFRLTRGRIRGVLQVARDQALLQHAGERSLDASAIARACRQQTGSLLEGLAQRIEPRCGWSDIVLPATSLTQLHEIAAAVRQRARVYGEWGFGDKLSRGRGLAALFSGPSGTGKTLAAEIIAGVLDLELFRIDLAAVVSKYIGETEKNLSRIFTQAERGSAVLLFDEADALFGKRSEVKDAHDRYANIEISYLLQRIEEYEGIAILATNLKSNIDEAFLRRLQFIVEFPFPDAVQRARIWRGLFPLRAPRAPDVDIDFLATRLPVAGGNIKNIVMQAAFLAAADGGVIGMSHLMRAAKREYDKIGRLGGAEDFGAYWGLVSAGAT